jgi:hypothetical protein
MEGNIWIYGLPKNRGTDQWKRYCPGQRRRKYRFPRQTSKMQMLVLTDNLSARKSNSNTVCFQTNYRRLNTLYNNTN